MNESVQMVDLCIYGKYLFEITSRQPNNSTIPNCFKGVFIGLKTFGLHFQQNSEILDDVDFTSNCFKYIEYFISDYIISTIWKPTSFRQALPPNEKSSKQMIFSGYYY